jgi:hypothetical protein
MGRYGKSHSANKESVSYFRHLNQVLLLAGALLPLLLFIWEWQHSAVKPPFAGPAAAAVTAKNNPVLPLNAALETRHIFPFSVIPGGAHDAQELKNALLNDPVAAAHYAGFDVAHTHVVRLDRNELMYVSYRIGDHIYWTSRKLMLPEGETVLTDGENEGRTRCGNRLSETPQLPISSKEPSSAMLAGPPLTLPAPPAALPESAIIEPLALPKIASADPVGGRIFIPPFIPIAGGSGTPTLYPPPNNPPPILPPPPPVATPEPSSLLLLSAGLFGVLAIRRKLQS